MTWYGRKAGSKIAELLKEMSGEKEKLLNLEEEVQLARVMAQRAVELYETAHLGPDAHKVNDETKALATANLRVALDHVTMTVEKATKVRVMMAEGNVDADDIRTLAQSLTANVIEAGRKLALNDEQIEQLTSAMAQTRVPDGKRVTVVIG